MNTSLSAEFQLPSRFSKIHRGHVLDAIQEAYVKAVNKKNVRNGFQKARLWPLDTTAAAGSRMRKYFRSQDIVPVKELIQDIRIITLDMKRNKSLAAFVKCGFVDTTSHPVRML